MERGGEEVGKIGGKNFQRIRGEECGFDACGKSQEQRQLLVNRRRKKIKRFFHDEKVSEFLRLY